MAPYTPENNPMIPGDPYSYDLKWMVEQINGWKDPADSADRAKASEDAAKASELNSEAWAVGTKDGEPVDPAEPQHDNYSKFWAGEAADSAAAAKDSEDAAADYAAHIADPVSGIVTQWLADHITQPTTPAIDTSLSIAGAAADAKAVGDSAYLIRDQITTSGEALSSYHEQGGYTFNSAAVSSLTDAPSGLVGISSLLNFKIFAYFKYTLQIVFSSNSLSAKKYWWRVLDNTYTEYLPWTETLFNIPANHDYDNLLTGKKIVFCGDSFTQGDFTGLSPSDYTFNNGIYAGQKKVYPYFIGNRTGATIVNEAICGSTMTYIDGTHNEFSTPGGRYTQIPADAEYIILWFGINDNNNSVPIGSISDSSNTTFYGAWNTVMSWLVANRPDAKIGIVITNGCPNTAYPIAERAIAKKYGVSCLDINGDYNIPILFRVSEKPDVDATIRNNNNAHFKVSASNFHPNVALHEFQSSIIEHWLLSL